MPMRRALLAGSGRKARQPAIELVEDPAIEFVEPERVDLQQVERFGDEAAGIFCDHVETLNFAAAKAWLDQHDPDGNAGPSRTGNEHDE